MKQPDDFDDSSRKVLRDRLIAEKRLARAQANPTSFPNGPANFTVKAGNYRWNFHRDTVAAKSEYFALMTSSEWSEANECLVDLSNDEPELLARMFIWCYCRKYPVGIDVSVVNQAKTVLEIFREGWQGDERDFKEPRYTQSEAILHLKMLMLSDYYMMPKLERYCLIRLDNALHEDAKEFMSCLKGLQEVTVNLPNYTMDKVVACMVEQSHNNMYFSTEQASKIRAAFESFPELEGARIATGA